MSRRVGVLACSAHHSVSATEPTVSCSSLTPSFYFPGVIGSVSSLGRRNMITGVIWSACRAADRRPPATQETHRSPR